ncbi:MAG: hypothetical protein JXB62_14625 [Pirellulales bacterium]|nr:hypothetical protein [Pirellulales bacterium]
MKTVTIRSALGLLYALAALPLAADSPQTSVKYVLQGVRKPGDTDRVVIRLEVGGDVLQAVETEIHRMKLSVVCDLSYDEKVLQLPNASDGRARSIRHYDQVDPVIKVEDDGMKPVLRPQRRLIGVQVDPPKVTLFSPNGKLTRDELELVDILGNSLLLEQLLPEGPVAVGESWSHDEKLILALLGMDVASRVDVQSKLTEVTGTAARFELSGRVEGALCGAATEIELKAKYRFDRRTRRIDWLGLLIQEKRGVGHVKRGVDVVARLQVRISPEATPAALTEAALEDLSLQPTAALEPLSYQSAEGGWQLTHDRRWHLIGENPDLAVLRMVDRGELIAQCNVSPLPKLAANKEVPLSAFQDDVRKALGESFGEFIEAAQWASDADHRIYRVVVQGKVAELPIQWHYYLVSDKHGRQVAFAFSVEGNLVDRLDDADQKLVDSLRFLEPKVASSGK